MRSSALMVLPLTRASAVPLKKRGIWAGTADAPHAIGARRANRLRPSGAGRTGLLKTGRVQGVEPARPGKAVDVVQRPAFPSSSRQVSLAAITFRRRGQPMIGDRSLLYVVATASLLVGIGGCGGVTQFAGAQAFTIAGTPPPPPPPPVAKEEPPKPPPRVEL